MQVSHKVACNKANFLTSLENNSLNFAEQIVSKNSKTHTLSKKPRSGSNRWRVLSELTVFNKQKRNCFRYIVQGYEFFIDYV